MNKPTKEYREALVRSFWAYQQSAFVGHDGLFECSTRVGDRPPVFRSTAMTSNIVTVPGLSEVERRHVFATIPPYKRHRWFRSMKSSQALAQSVFGTLNVCGRLDILSDIVSDIGDRPFADLQIATLERSVTFLGEDPRRSTSVDVWLSGNRAIAVECKFAEDGMGTCSRPRLDPLEADFCNRSFSVQNDRTSRCSLTEVGIRYWEYVPKLLNWDSGRDWPVCPLSNTYQIVRNLIAATGREDGSVDMQSGAMVLLIDERNPAFRTNGGGRIAFDSVRAALFDASLLQLVTWQQVVVALRSDETLRLLAEQLDQKYGLGPQSIEG